jgi:1-deoxy-D-xylulose-5-phosphate reductoisomerase
MKRLAILGSTGSIGTQTLDVAARFPERFRVAALAAGRNVELLAQQAKQLRPERVCVPDASDLLRLREALSGTGIACTDDVTEIAGADVDLVVAAQVGHAGLLPVLAALRAGTDVALANKEVLVMAGELVVAEARRTGARLLPLDSEHVAIAQCLAGQPARALRRIVLTASGGPLRDLDVRALADVTVERALAHPNWTMGRKITIDSATLMNKGFEWIEAVWLFDVAPAQVEIVIHPESIVHSLVELCDGSWLAQLGVPDMRVPIAYTLGLPDRLPLMADAASEETRVDGAGAPRPAGDVARLDLVAAGSLRFVAPDPARYPALDVVRDALDAGGTAPAAMNAANEVAVEAFLERRIPFSGIVRTVEATLRAHAPVRMPALGDILEADRAARAHAAQTLEEHYA